MISRLPRRANAVQILPMVVTGCRVDKVEAGSRGAAFMDNDEHTLHCGPSSGDLLRLLHVRLA